ncbi:hypothetical protein GEMRC1_010857 [Eukaryota sp. GEM-RC1]
MCAKKSCNKFVTKEISPLDIAENNKQRKYADPLKDLKHIVHVEYSLVPFAISIYGGLCKLALKFLDEDAKVVARNTNKIFDRSYWQNRIVFTILKAVPTMISKALLSLCVFYEDKASTKFDSKESCFDDIEY